MELNGAELNGAELNGAELNGVELNGVELNGVELNGVELNGSELNGVELNGSRLQGVDFVGAVLVGRTSNGPLQLRVDNVNQTQDVFFYNVSYLADSHWLPLCGVDQNQEPIPATALSGRWDYRQGVRGGGSHIDAPGQFTFACMTGALGKCVAWGYKPWDTITQCSGHDCRQISLAATHQACTRMVRADYCGDGTPHTVNGTVINIYDAFGIQLDTENWPLEAEWTPNGARCVVRPRIEDTNLPQCALSLKRDRTCGHLRHFQTGTLLMDEVKAVETNHENGD
jgi:hypothetical protein